MYVLHDEMFNEYFVKIIYRQVYSNKSKIKAAKYKTLKEAEDKLSEIISEITCHNSFIIKKI